jgi:hypothetical protein
LDKGVRQALAEAGERLADALRERLAAQGLSDELEMALDGDRLRVVSHAREIHAAEIGRAGMAPTAPMESAARQAASGIVQALGARLRGCVR